MSYIIIIIIIESLSKNSLKFIMILESKAFCAQHALKSLTR